MQEAETVCCGEGSVARRAWLAKSGGRAITIARAAAATVDEDMSTTLGTSNSEEAKDRFKHT